MSNFAYIVVTEDHQDIQIQNINIMKYCNRKKIRPITVIKEELDKLIYWKERAIGNLVDESSKGDIIVVSEISRLSASITETMEIIKLTQEKGVSIHITKLPEFPFPISEEFKENLRRLELVNE